MRTETINIKLTYPDYCKGVDEDELRSKAIAEITKKIDEGFWTHFEEHAVDMCNYTFKIEEEGKIFKQGRWV